MDQKVVVVSGASGALGRAVMQRFKQEGQLVVALGSNAQRLEENCGSVADACLAGDLCDAQRTQEIFAEIEQQFGRLDVLINVTGGFAMGQAVHETSEDTWQQMLDMNVRTLVNCVQASVPSMLKQNRGWVLNVGSASAKQGIATMGAYVASKSAVERLTESMAEELRAQGIHVNAVLPSIIDSAVNRAAMPDADPAAWVSPEQLADVIAFLCSDAASAIHGACIPVRALS